MREASVCSARTRLSVLEVTQPGDGVHLPGPDELDELRIVVERQLQGVSAALLSQRPQPDLDGAEKLSARARNFLTFLKQVAKAYPRVQLHVVADNYATHKHPAVKAWLDRNPRAHMHFTPTSGSWLNLVECFFSIITRQAIRRGAFTSVDDLIITIEAYIDGWNEQTHPFTWTKLADEILAKLKPTKTEQPLRQTTSRTYPRDL